MQNFKQIMHEIAFSHTKTNVWQYCLCEATEIIFLSVSLYVYRLKSILAMFHCSILYISFIVHEKSFKLNKLRG